MVNPPWPIGQSGSLVLGLLTLLLVRLLEVQLGVALRASFY